MESVGLFNGNISLSNGFSEGNNRIITNIYWQDNHSLHLNTSLVTNLYTLNLDNSHTSKSKLIVAQ